MSATMQERPTGSNNPEALGEQDLRDATHLGGFVMAGITGHNLQIATAMTGTGWRVKRSRYSVIKSQPGQQTAKVYGDEFEAGRRMLSDHDLSRPSRYAPRVALSATPGIIPGSMSVEFALRTAPDGVTRHSVRNRTHAAELGIDTASETGLWMSIYEPLGHTHQPYEGGPRSMTIGRSAAKTAEILADLIGRKGHNLVSLAVQDIDMRTGEVKPPVVISNYDPNPNPENFSHYDFVPRQSPHSD